MKKFRYLIRGREVLEDLDELNKLGDEGWEFVGIETTYTDNVIFKQTILKTKENIVNAIDEDENDEDDYDDYNDIVFEEPKEINIYEDSNISVVFKGLEKGSFLFGGEAYSVKFLVENKTNQTIDVKALDVTLNGFVLENSSSNI